MWRRYPAARWTACLTLLASAALFAANRPARVITPQGSPIWLDPQRTLVFDAPSLTVMQRNEHSQSVNYALRLWVFDESSHLKGTQDFCTYDAMGGHTRGLIVVPIAIAGVTLRDSTVVAVTAAVSGQVSWSLREDERAQLEEALAAIRGSTARLTFQREVAGPGGWNCRRLRQSAGSGLRAALRTSRPRVFELQPNVRWRLLGGLHVPVKVWCKTCTDESVFRSRPSARPGAPSARALRAGVGQRGVIKLAV